MLTGEYNINKVIRSLAAMGPEYVVVKRGEYGFMAYQSSTDELFVMPAYPVQNLVDPTGAGDTFAGGVFGYLASLKEWNFEDVKAACVHGCVTASFTVEGMGVSGVQKLSLDQIYSRTKDYLKIIHVGPGVKNLSALSTANRV